MATVRGAARKTTATKRPVIHATDFLCNGDRMKQPEFHRRYESYPDHIKFELIGGTVYMASPVSIEHGDHGFELNLLFGLYRLRTPGVHGLNNHTTILGEESEPQPDAGLRILPEFGGRSENVRIKRKLYIKGPPELLAEVGYSTRALDLYQKKDDYQRSGVLEYMVVCVEEKELHWFHFPSGDKIVPDARGISKSRVFPGLWIDVKALLALDSARVEKAVRRGLKSREHAEFVKRLKAARRA